MDGAVEVAKLKTMDVEGTLDEEERGKEKGAENKKGKKKEREKEKEMEEELTGATEMKTEGAEKAVGVASTVGAKERTS